MSHSITNVHRTFRVEHSQTRRHRSRYAGSERKTYLTPYAEFHHIITLQHHHRSTTREFFGGDTLGIIVGCTYENTHMRIVTLMGSIRRLGTHTTCDAKRVWCTTLAYVCVTLLIAETLYAFLYGFIAWHIVFGLCPKHASEHRPLRRNLVRFMCARRGSL